VTTLTRPGFVGKRTVSVLLTPGTWSFGSGGATAVRLVVVR
jgi:hypothetical protein